MFFFFFNDTATTEIYTLSLHDAPSDLRGTRRRPRTQLRAHRFLARLARRRMGEGTQGKAGCRGGAAVGRDQARSEEHTSELQSRQYLVCRLLLEKKKNTLT